MRSGKCSNSRRTALRKEKMWNFWFRDLHHRVPLWLMMDGTELKGVRNSRGHEGQGSTSQVGNRPVPAQLKPQTRDNGTVS